MAKRRKGPDLFHIAVHRALSDALYEKLLDESWDEIAAVFDAPKVREARKKFLRAFAEEMAKRGGKDGI
jgi:hypothetical protein